MIGVLAGFVAILGTASWLQWIMSGEGAHAPEDTFDLGGVHRRIAATGAVMGGYRLPVRRFLGADGPNLSEMPLSKPSDSSSAGCQVCAYHLDFWLSTSNASKVYLLMGIVCLLALVGGVSLYAVSSDTLYAAFWEALDGLGLGWSFAEGAADRQSWTGLIMRLLAVGISIGGTLITALLLGLTSEAIDSKISNLKRGKAEVIESNHVLILGWSSKIVKLLQELCLAERHQSGGAIVILAERPKEDMELDLRKQRINTYGCRIICRSGSPLHQHDLGTVSVAAARTIIVLAVSEAVDQSDARALRVVLMLMALHQRLLELNTKTGGLQGDIIAEICDVDNQSLVNIVGLGKVTAVVSKDTVGRLMVLCARQPGLSAVWEALLGTDGAQLYIEAFPELAGRTFGEVLLMFHNATVLGLTTSDPSACARRVDYAIPDSDQHVLYVGWPRDIKDLIQVLDELVIPGSELWLFSEVPLEEREQRLRLAAFDPATEVQHLKVIYKDPALEGGCMSRKQLSQIKVTDFTAIVIFLDEDASGVHVGDCDSRSIAMLLLLRNIQQHQLIGLPEARSKLPHARWHKASEQAVRQERAVQSTTVMIEVVDVNSRRLVKDIHLGEYLMSNDIISMALATVAQKPALNVILKELQSEPGQELYVFPAERYLRPIDELNWWELMMRARRRQQTTAGDPNNPHGDEIAIGFKRHGEHRPVLNPQDRVTRMFSLHNVQSIVVLADY
eukprot:jgi/Astpho2/8880/Aster-05510